MKINDIKEFLSKNPGIMRQELAREIEKNLGSFGIDSKNINALFIENFLKEETSFSLEGLKQELKNISRGETISEKQIEDLSFIISGARDVLKKSIKQEIDSLKGEFTETKSFHPQNFISSKILPVNLLLRVQNPQNIGDHLTGLALGFLNSGETLVQILYDIGKGIIKTPYHISLIISGKGEYTGIKKI